MKKHYKLLIAMIMMVSFISCTQSQEREGFERGRNMNPEQMIQMQVDRMSTALELTDDQKEEVKELYLKFNKRQADVRESNRGDRESMRSEMQEINQEREQKLKEILDTDQWTKWQEVREQFRNRRGQRRPGGES